MITYNDYEEIRCSEEDSNLIIAPIAFSIGEDEEKILLADCNFLPYVY